MCFFFHSIYLKFSYLLSVFICRLCICGLCGNCIDTRIFIFSLFVKYFCLFLYFFFSIFYRQNCCEFYSMCLRLCMCMFFSYYFFHISFAAIYFGDLIWFQSHKDQTAIILFSFIVMPFHLNPCWTICPHISLSRSLSVCVCAFCSIEFNSYSLFHKYTSMFNVHIDLILNDKNEIKKEKNLKEKQKEREREEKNTRFSSTFT